MATKSPTFGPDHLSAMDNQNRYDLIARGVQEVMGGEIVQQILSEGRTPKCYWGTAPTGRHMRMAHGTESNSVILCNRQYRILRGSFQNCRFSPSWRRSESLAVLERFLTSRCCRLLSFWWVIILVASVPQLS